MTFEWISNSGAIEASTIGVEDEFELGAFDADGNPMDYEEFLALELLELD